MSFCFWQAFDFCKVIESFVVHESRLPAHLKAHFAEVDAKILEAREMKT